MPLDSLIALTALLAASLWTPGPNNAMLASSGATFGFRRTVPHLLGVALGFSAMIFLVALGLGEVFVRVPQLYDVVRIAGIALLLWVAWRIANTKAPGSPGARTRPFTFLQASGFQWVNPKAWAMCVSIGAQFVNGSDALAKGLVVAGLSVSVGLCSATAWAGFGAALGRFLRDPARLRAFNFGMAGLVLLGVAYLVADGLA